MNKTLHVRLEKGYISFLCKKGLFLLHALEVLCYSKLIKSNLFLYIAIFTVKSEQGKIIANLQYIQSTTQN